VAGTLVPDSAGSYTTRDWYGNKAYSQRADTGYSIWWDTDTDSWIISAILGTKGTDWWSRTDPDIIGVFSPLGTATGDATVTKSV